MNRGMKTFIWAVVVMGFVAVAGAVIVGSIYRDKEISDEPYEEGLRWDQDRARMRELGWKMQATTIEIKDKRARLVLEVTGPEGAVIIDPLDMRAVASRPAGELQDIPCQVDQTAGRRLEVLCELGTYGKWDFVMDIDTASGPVRFVEHSYVDKRRR